MVARTDDTPGTAVWRFERHGHGIRHGAKLTVREGRAAAFVHEGRLADAFGPGLLELGANNTPIMTTLQHRTHGSQSPFGGEVHFVPTTRVKWGTRKPITMRTPEFGPVRRRAFGTQAVRVTDLGPFLREIVGTDGEFTTDEVTNQIHSVVVQPVATASGTSASWSPARPAR